MGATRPQKRRRIVSASSAPPPAAQPTSKQHVIVSSRPICSMCHRALNTAQSSLIICARCSSPTCAICSRTCTSTLPSIPPIPMSPSQSPRRFALPLHSANTNLCDLQHTVAPVANIGKRRKVADEDDHHSREGLEGGVSESDLAPGCGRTTCRNCCFEDVQSDSTTCYDCYGH